jgi:hypothetical protein
MTKRELIEALKIFDDNATILIDVPMTEWQTVGKVRRDDISNCAVLETIDYEE